MSKANTQPNVPKTQQNLEECFYEHKTVQIDEELGNARPRTLDRRKVSSELGSRDVRQALRVAKLAKTYTQVDSVVRTLLRYTKREGS